MNEMSKNLAEAIERAIKPATSPVAVKLAGKGDVTAQKMKRPVKDLGNPMAVCQGMTLARTIGWSFAFASGDHACPFPSVFLGHLDPEQFLGGAVAGFYQDDAECAKRMEADYPRWGMGEIEEVWLAPAARCEFEADLVVAYGNPAQIVALIQAANFREGSGVMSKSMGRAGCSAWLSGVAKSGACTYLVPGPGERIFGGTQDHEMCFAIPLSKAKNFIEGLEYVKKQGAYRYPVPNLMLLNEPKMPAKYLELAKGKGG